MNEHISSRGKDLSFGLSLNHHSYFVYANIKGTWETYACTGLDKQNISALKLNIFLPISCNICFGCSKEPSHWDGSFEYPQHMFWLRNKKINFSLHTLN